MKTITKELYYYCELTESAKEKAREIARESIYSGKDDILEFDMKNSVEWAKDQLQELGIEDVEVSYSGFCSQGDGLSFTGQVIELKKFLGNINLLEEHKEIVGKIIANNGNIYFTRDRYTHYVHENTVSVYLTGTGFEKHVYFEECATLLEAVKAWRLEKCRYYYSNFEKEYNRYNDDDTVREYIESNECEETFLEDGTIA